MIRTLATTCLAAILSGCCLFSDLDGTGDLSTVPPADSSNPVDKYADGADIVMDRAAASIQVAREANQAGKPQVVEAELGVAATVLPRPTPGEVTRAKSRAAKADQGEYARAVAEADKLQRSLDELWGQVEAEKEKARQQVVSKQQELDAERARFRDLLWSMAGIAVVLVGGAGFVWGSALGVTKAEAATIVLVGFAVGSLPWLLESELSGWIIAPAAGLVALRGVVWLWSKGWRKPRQVEMDLFTVKPANENAKAKEVPTDRD